jgi:hypothetical protein
MSNMSYMFLATPVAAAAFVVGHLLAVAEELE